MLNIGLESSGTNNYVQLAGVLLQKKHSITEHEVAGNAAAEKASRREFHGDWR